MSSRVLNQLMLASDQRFVRGQMRPGICLAVLMLLTFSGCTGMRDRLLQAGKSGSSIGSLHAADRTTRAEVCRRTGMELAAYDRDEHAIAQFERALEIQPEMRGIAHPLAVLYDRQGRIDDAERQYQRALKESPRSADVLNDYGYFQYSQGQIEDAELYLLRALSRDAKHRQANVNLGLVYAARGDFERSFEVFERATGKAAAHHNVGMLLAREGRTQEAISHLEASVRRDPSLQQTHAILAQLRPSAADSGIRQVTATSDDLHDKSDLPILE